MVCVAVLVALELYRVKGEHGWGGKQALTGTGLVQTQAQGESKCETPKMIIRRKGHLPLIGAGWRDHRSHPRHTERLKFTSSLLLVTLEWENLVRYPLTDRNIPHLFCRSSPSLLRRLSFHPWDKQR